MGRTSGMRRVLVAAVVLLGGCTSGLGGDGSASRRIDKGTLPESRPGEPARSTRVVNVVSTSSVVSDLVRLVGSTNVRTHTVVKAGLDPIRYRLTTVDREQARRADVVFAVGRGLEPWVADLGGPVPVLLSTGLPERTTPSGAPDPFVWHDPDNAKVMLRAIAQALSAVAPPDAAAFAFSVDAAVEKVDAADAGARRLLGALAGRSIVTTKESMGWFASHYGLVVAGSVVPSPDGSAEVSPDHLSRLRQAMVAAKVVAVFGEASSPPEQAVALARESGVTAVTGSDALCSDGLGPAGTSADSYVGCLTHNAREIAAHV